MALSKPSSPDPVYTPGTARGAKLAALLVDEGTTLVRKILEDEVLKMNPPSLPAQLKKHKGYLCGLRHLNPGQRKTLYPANGDTPDTAQGFDINLIELLLKELARKELHRKAPHADQRNSLREYRNNNYGHVSSTDLSEGDFNRLWKELTEILIALGGDKDRIAERHNQSIDPELAENYFVQIEQQYKDDLEVKDLLLAQEESQQKRQGQLLSQGESHKEEILWELRKLPEKIREAQSPGTFFEQCKDSCSRTGLADLTDDVIACLKDLYNEAAHVTPLPWCEDFKPHLENIFTNLRLQHCDDDGTFHDTDTVVSLAHIYNTSRAEAKKVVKKVRVEGDPGIGKSCSCQKLAYDWSCGKLDRFKVVFLLEMRHLAGEVKYEIFEQLLPEDTKTTPEQLWSYIQENQDDVLFILDGLDELSQAAREVTDVLKLIQGKILRNCHVLVTSRPLHCVKDLEKCHQFYKIVGFTEKNSEQAMHKYCKSLESASKLVEQLHGNRNLSELVVNPLNNVLICVVWEDNNNTLPSSKAELYKQIILSVAKRFCTKKNLPTEGDELPRSIEEALRDLGKLSWEGLEQEQLQFKQNDITKTYGTNADNMLNMGLLTRDYSFARINRICYCSFLHKTFQEYLAACYIRGIVTDKSSREDGMKCLRTLFGLTKTDIDRELISNSRRRHREVQNMLPLILGEKAGPLFDMFAEELGKAQTDEDRAVLSFVCIMLLGKSSAGGKMAEIVAPFLPQHVTNNVGDLTDQYDDHIDWFVGLTHVLTCQKKLNVSNNPRLIQHLTVNCGHITASPAEQEKFDLLENTLSEYGKIRSVTLLEDGGGFSAGCHNFSPLRTFIPRCGMESLSIRINPGFTLYLSLFRALAQLSEAPMVENIRISVGGVKSDMFGPDADFSEYDRLLAHVISRQSCLRSMRLKVTEWSRGNSEIRGFGNLAATLQSISEHASLQDVEFELPRNDHLVFSEDTRFDNEVVCMVNNVPLIKYKAHETVNVEPMVYNLTECLKKNKVLKTLALRWRLGKVQSCTNKIYYGVCSSQSVSNLCLAIRRNRTLRSLVIDGMFAHGQLQPRRKARMVAKLKRHKPSNYEELRITIVKRLLPSRDDFVTFPHNFLGIQSDRTGGNGSVPSPEQ
ncbi:uncharacterized protein LOC144877603 [Branchiostoma floridae x Branchiostoma japonicum]